MYKVAQEYVAGKNAVTKQRGLTRPSSSRSVGVRDIGAVHTLYPALQACGVTERVSRGFTLIELLVVVLIIGILAAVALPQYQKAVIKSRAAELVLFVKDAQKAMQLYFLQNGYPDSGCLSFYSYNTDNLDKLDITLPVGSLTEKGYSLTVSLCNPSVGDYSQVQISASRSFDFHGGLDATLQINNNTSSCGGYNSSGVAMCKALTEQLGGTCIDAQTDGVCK